jgi:hypothetical protein
MFLVWRWEWLGMHEGGMLIAQDTVDQGVTIYQAGQSTPAHNVVSAAQYTCI